MGKAIVTELTMARKTVRQYYSEAYSALRGYYAGCQSGQFSDLTLIDWKLELWKKHGKYLDIVWQHHFAKQVADATGQGWAHGWTSPLRREMWLCESYRRAIEKAGW